LLHGRHGNLLCHHLITVGNGYKTPFWHAPWLYGRKPIDIAPLIYTSSMLKNWKVNAGMKYYAWVQKLKVGEDFTMEYLTQFFTL
jgi:hypothetical protein